MAIQNVGKKNASQQFQGWIQLDETIYMHPVLNHDPLIDIFAFKFLYSAIYLAYIFFLLSKKRSE